MRRWITAYALLVAASLLVWPLAAPLLAAFAHVQTRTACASGCDVPDDFSDASMTVTGLTGLTVGNCVSVVAMHGHTTRTFNVPTDGGSNTYSEAVENLDGVQGGVAISFARVATTATAVTVTLSGGSAFGDDLMVVYEDSGCADPLALDPTNNADTAATTTHASGTVTTTTANGLLVFGGKCSGGVYTPDGAWTTTTNGARHVIAYDHLTATGTQGFTMTSADNETCALAIASLQGAADGGGGSGQKRLLFWGIGN